MAGGRRTMSQGNRVIASCRSGLVQGLHRAGSALGLLSAAGPSPNGPRWLSESARGRPSSASPDTDGCPRSFGLDVAPMSRSSRNTNAFSKLGDSNFFNAERYMIRLDMESP